MGGEKKAEAFTHLRLVLPGQLALPLAGAKDVPTPPDVSSKPTTQTNLTKQRDRT